MMNIESIKNNGAEVALINEIYSRLWSLSRLSENTQKNGKLSGVQDKLNAAEATISECKVIMDELRKNYQGHS